MASAKAKIRHVFGDTFSGRAAPPDMYISKAQWFRPVNFVYSEVNSVYFFFL